MLRPDGSPSPAPLKNQATERLNPTLFAFSYGAYS